jgi:hypothetical protein
MTTTQETLVELAIEAWHDRAGAELHDWLGWSWEEYQAFVTNGTIPRPPKHFAALTTPPIDDITGSVAGWKLVPVEPTEAMLQGACAKHRPGLPMQATTPLRGYEGDTRECPAFAKRRSIWSAMLSSSPDKGS